MPRYREHERKQSIMVPIRFDQQIQPRTLEHAIDYLVDNEIDLSEFEAVYRNDDTGAPAIHPGILLKIVLFAYSRGIISSRRMARACEENVLFMALSGDTRPHFTLKRQLHQLDGRECGESIHKSTCCLLHPWTYECEDVRRRWL